MCASSWFFLTYVYYDAWFRNIRIWAVVRFVAQQNFQQCLGFCISPYIFLKSLFYVMKLYDKIFVIDYTVSSFRHILH
jgi:hypothetical protein